MQTDNSFEVTETGLSIIAVSAPFTEALIRDCLAGSNRTLILAGPTKDVFMFLRMLPGNNGWAFVMVDIANNATIQSLKAAGITGQLVDNVDDFVTFVMNHNWTLVKPADLPNELIWGYGTASWLRNISVNPNVTLLLVVPATLDIPVLDLLNEEFKENT
jgi:hypothetical protein